jgi:hypothetical protein
MRAWHPLASHSGGYESLLSSALQIVDERGRYVESLAEFSALPAVDYIELIRGHGAYGSKATDDRATLAWILNKAIEAQLEKQKCS